MVASSEPRQHILQPTGINYSSTPNDALASSPSLSPANDFCFPRRCSIATNCPQAHSLILSPTSHFSVIHCVVDFILFGQVFFYKHFLNFIQILFVPHLNLIQNISKPYLQGDKNSSEQTKVILTH